jgi:hypothetical protein
MKKRSIVPTLLIAGLGVLGGLAGAAPSRADWICQELQGSQCFPPSDIFCFWSDTEVGHCNCQENDTYLCVHDPQARSASTGTADFLRSLQGGSGAATGVPAC